MSELDAIRGSEHPVTRSSIARELRALGVEPGFVLLVHSSLSSLGWVCGGQQAVVLALMDVVTEAGTLVMPTHTTGNSDPATWENPAVPAEWWPIIREEMPAFDPALTPSRGMGAIPELFRTAPQVLRSEHPSTSFAAWGKYAETVTAGHALESQFGDGSPLARVYDLDGHVLLFGVGHDSNTSLHLAECRAEWPGKEMVEQGAAVRGPDGARWVSWVDQGFRDDDFADIGKAFESDPRRVDVGPVGNATSRLMSQRAVVDFGAEWMTVNR